MNEPIPSLHAMRSVAETIKQAESDTGLVTSRTMLAGYVLALVAEVERLRAALAGCIPPERIRLLADWLDQEDARGRWPERSSEVQDDLRKMAKTIEQAGSVVTAAPASVEPAASEPATAIKCIYCQRPILFAVEECQISCPGIRSNSYVSIHSRCWRELGEPLMYEKLMDAIHAKAKAEPPPAAAEVPICPDCGRQKATNWDDVKAGRCPKWFAIRNPDTEADTEADCRRFAKFLKAADAEDACGGISVGGLAVDLGMYKAEPPATAGKTPGQVALFKVLKFDSTWAVVWDWGNVNPNVPNRIWAGEFCQERAAFDFCSRLNEAAARAVLGFVGYERE